MECESESWTIVKGRSEGKKEAGSFSNQSRNPSKPPPSQKGFKLRTRNEDHNVLIGSDSKMPSVEIFEESRTSTTDKHTDGRVSSTKERTDHDYSDKIGASFKTFVNRVTPDITNTSDHLTLSKSPQVYGRNITTHTHKGNTQETQSKSDLYSKREDGPKRGTRGLFRINPAVGLVEIVPSFKTMEDGRGGRKDVMNDKPDINLSSEGDWPSIAVPEGPGDVIEGAAVPGSWSKVLKAPAPPRVIRKVHDPEMTSDHPPAINSNSDDDDGGGQDGKGKKKKRKKKKKGSGQPTVPNERRVDQPLMLELGSVFEALEIKKSKKIVLATGAPVVTNLNTPPLKPIAKEKVVQRSGNLLDSSAPVMRRGKEREAPKKKHPSAMRKVITKEKEEKKRLVTEQQVAMTATPVSPSSPSITVEGEEDVEEPIPTRKPHPPVAVTNSKSTIHSKRFREYCSHVVKDEINDCAAQLLTDLVRFQDRQYQKDPIRAKAKRRYVCGLREVTKHLKLRKLKCVIVPPNLDRIQSTGGIDDAVDGILVECTEQEVSVVFAMSRRRLAYVLKKKHKIGCVGIFSYDGAETHYKQLMQLVSDAREEYQLKTAALKETDKQPLYIVQTKLNRNADISSNNSDPTKPTSEEQQIIDSNSDSESEDSGVCSGNGTQTTQQSLLDTPWRVFFQNGHTPTQTQTSADALNLAPSTNTSSKDENSSTNSCTPDVKMAALVEFEPGQTALTSTPCLSLQNGDSSLTFRTLNANANEFVPPFQFSLNIDAQEFVPPFQFSLNIDAQEFVPDINV